jgi:hypothetical protein
VPIALLLSMHDLGAWSAGAAVSPAVGGLLPYEFQHLRSCFELRWSDAQRRGVWRTRLPRAIGGAVRRQAPGVQGSLAMFYAIPRMRAADVALSVLENVSLGLARAQRPSWGSRSGVPHVMLACWLAEDCRQMSPSQLRSVRRSVGSISKIVVFSTNQVAILTEFLGLVPARIGVVPFGVDTEFYSPSRVTAPTGGGGLVAVGSDSRRDYAALLEAVRIADVPLTLVCCLRNIKNLQPPPRVTLLTGVGHEEYRKLLLSADLIVTPTTAPAYPSGQSVVLEAMSMGRATLTTDSPAMRDYVTGGVDGVLVPPREPEATGKLIVDLLADPGKRQSLGTAAEKTVRECFGLEQLWQGVADLLSAEIRSYPKGRARTGGQSPHRLAGSYREG